MQSVSQIVPKSGGETVQAVEDSVLKDEIRRLKGYSKYEEFKTEILRVMRLKAKTAEHAKLVTTRLIDGLRRSPDGFVPSVPTPAEVADAFDATPGNLAFGKADPACQQCSGYGYRIEQRILRDGTKAEGAERCACTIRETKA